MYTYSQFYLESTDVIDMKCECPNIAPIKKRYEIERTQYIADLLVVWMECITLIIHCRSARRSRSD